VARLGDVAVARAGDVVDRHHGEAVPDPYRWLENAADPETAASVSAQNERTQAWLAAASARAQIRSQLGEQWNDARFGVPAGRGGRWFQTRNPGLRARPVRYVMDAPRREGRVLIEPNVLSDEGTVALGAISVSPDGSKVAYATAASAAQRGDAPILLRVETPAGHSSAGKPTAKAIAEAADRLAFLERALACTPL